jgi:sarcosine oxidase subunit gamma
VSDPGAVSAIEVRDAAFATILLRRGAAGDASRALQARYGVSLPAPGRLETGDGIAVVWQGPDRFLAVRGGEERELNSALQSALDGLAHIVDSSSSRVILTVTGGGTRDALAKLLPIDLHPREFPPGSVALTVAGHIDVQVWRQDASHDFHIACARSLAASLRRLLAEAGIAGKPRSDPNRH